MIFSIIMIIIVKTVLQGQITRSAIVSVSKFFNFCVNSTNIFALTEIDCFRGEHRLFLPHQF